MQQPASRVTQIPESFTYLFVHGVLGTMEDPSTTSWRETAGEAGAHCAFPAGGTLIQLFDMYVFGTTGRLRRLIV